MRIIHKGALLAALLAGLAGGQPGAAQTPAMRPIMETHTIPPYPPESVTAQEQGTTLMEVLINTEGVVDGCRVLQTSSSERLDQAACAHVTRLWRWTPPTLEGRPTNVRTRVSVKWDLRQAPVSAPDPLRPIMKTHTIPPYPSISVRLQEEGRTLMLVHITTQGVVDECTVLETSGAERLDQAACDHVTRVWRWEPPTAQGQPINVLTRVAVTWALLDAPLSDTDDLRPIISTQTQPPYPALSPQPHFPGRTTMVVHLTTEGVADECTVVEKSASERLDQAACDHVKRFWRWQPPTAKGRPSDASVSVSIPWSNKSEKSPQLDFSVATTLTGCLSNNEDIRFAKCDLPFGILFIAARAASSRNDPLLCGLPRSNDFEKDTAAFKEKMLPWFRDHPETGDEHLARASRNAVKAVFACRL